MKYEVYFIKRLNFNIFKWFLTKFNLHGDIKDDIYPDCFIYTAHGQNKNTKMLTKSN